MESNDSVQVAMNQDDQSLITLEGVARLVTLRDGVAATGIDIRSVVFDAQVALVSGTRHAALLSMHEYLL